MQEAATICPRPIVTLTFDLLTLKVVSSVPILVFLGLSILDLGPMYATDRQTDRRQTASSLNAPAKVGGGGIVIAAETAASRKQAKHTVLSGSHMFQPICCGNSGPNQRIGCAVLKRSGLRITSVSADDKEGNSSSNDSLSLCRDSTLSCCTSRLG